MSECRGQRPVTAKVDAQMLDLLDNDAELVGVYRSELVRQVFDNYRELRRGEFQCPHCSNNIRIEP